jgi:quinol monooxygenase YgiN
MATEIARIDISSDEAEAFLAAAAQAVSLFQGAHGCSGMRVLRSAEEAGRFWLIVEWRDIAAHEAFRQSAGFAEWRALVGGYFSAPPIVEHGLSTRVGF